MVAVTKSNIDPNGLELVNIEWLLDHHKTKEHERRQMVDDFGLKQGDVVLDAGCGPGLWSSLFAEKVKPNGRVIGIDSSANMLCYAEKQLESEPLNHLIKYYQENLFALSLKDGTIDLVICGNCFSYSKEHEKLLDELRRVTKEGGRIAVKDFDGVNVIFHPIDPLLTLKVMTATAEALIDRPTNRHFDIMVGRKLHGLFIKLGLNDVSTRTYAIQKLSPLRPEVKRYMKANGEWYARIGARYLSEADLEQWRAHFDARSDEYILDREDFYFSMLEVLTIGTV